MKTKLFAVAGLIVALNANALMITPGSASYSGPETFNLSADQIAAQVGLLPGSLNVLYKQDHAYPPPLPADTGTFAASYTTTFSNSSADPADADIVYDGAPDPFISGFANLWLYVKDGNHNPGWYLINLGTSGLNWNGTETLALRNFWPDGGAISHVTILGGGEPQVPDGGTTLMLLGAALAGLGVVRRFLVS